MKQKKFMNYLIGICVAFGVLITSTYHSDFVYARSGNTDGTYRVIDGAVSNLLAAAVETAKQRVLTAVETANETYRTRMEKKQAAYDQKEKYEKSRIIYQVGNDTQLLDASVFADWISIDEDYQVQVDREQAFAYVKQLAEQYDTYYLPKTLQTSYGSTVTITNARYGWMIDKEAETDQLLSDIMSGKSVSRRPKYAASANSSENDFGDSYVEINLTAQHLFMYQDGELVVESDFVSGDVACNRKTRLGAFGLSYKQRNATLRGADYVTPVSYWMPFDGGIGMHDATWRSNFGGDIYLTNGSHGCINLPLNVAATIFENISANYPVLVYELPGTEQTSADVFADVNSLVAQINAIGEVTLEKEKQIANLRVAYNELSVEAKEQVTNYDVLVQAEQTLTALKKTVN